MTDENLDALCERLQSAYDRSEYPWMQDVAHALAAIKALREENARLTAELRGADDEIKHQAARATKLEAERDEAVKALEDISQKIIEMAGIRGG
jgi:uncharacterized protein involved in exopolysaccharide biosynthesis